MDTGRKRKIMIVDDTPQNLKLLGNMLRGEGYHVYSFPRGDFALKAAERNTPDLILLDINMPGMSGYEVCEKLQADPGLREIPVIFLSALNETEDKIKAFSSGGVDYITKPFQFEEVIARIGIHLALQDAQKELKDLLDFTVIGCVRAMAELLVLISPEEFGQTLRVARHVREMVRRMSLKKPWKYEMAALLSNLGYSISSEEGQGKSSREDRVRRILEGNHSEETDKNLELAAKVIRCIPRLENVPEMVMGQHYVPEWNSSWRRWSESMLGGQILKLVNDCNLLITHFGSNFRAFSELQKIEGIYNRELLEILQGVLTAETEGRSEKILPLDLQRGMILVQNMINRQGVELLPRGTELTESVLEHVRGWTSLGCISGITPITVLLSSEEKDFSQNRTEEDLEDFFTAASPE